MWESAKKNENIRNPNKNHENQKKIIEIKYRIMKKIKIQ